MANEIEKKYLLAENGQTFAGRYDSVVPDMCFKAELTRLVDMRVRGNALVGLIEAYNDLGSKAIQTVLPHWPYMQKLGQEANVLTQGYLPIEVGKSLAGRLGIRINGDIAESRMRKKHSLKTGVDSFVFTAKSDGSLLRQEYEAEVDEAVYKEFSKQFVSEIRKICMNYPLARVIADEDDKQVEHSWQHQWFYPTAEVDFYQNRNLVTAEVECPSIEIASRIATMGKDITSDKKYKNKNLALPL